MADGGGVGPVPRARLSSARLPWDGIRCDCCAARLRGGEGELFFAMNRGREMSTRFGEVSLNDLMALKGGAVATFTQYTRLSSFGGHERSEEGAE